MPEEKQTYPVRTLVGNTYKEEIWEDKDNYIFMFVTIDQVLSSNLSICVCTSLVTSHAQCIYL